MNTLLIAGAVALLYFAITKGWIKLDGGQVGQLARSMGGVALVGTAITLLIQGKFLVGLPAGLAGLWLMGYLKIPGFMNFEPQGTTQRSAMLDIAIDPGSGRIGGTIIAGSLKGRALDTLTKHESLILLRELQSADQTGLRLFAVYLDGRFPGWREDLQGGADAGTSRQARSGVMTDKEAHQILGLPPGAGEPAIREAHRRLMLKLHPDVGGSDTLAALVNEAKDVLLRRHR